MMGGVIYELNHVGGRIRNLDASLAFYTETIGAEVVDQLYMPGPSVDRVHVQLATGLVELLHNRDVDPDAAYGLNHVGFMTDDLDGDYARLIGAGYAELSAPKVAGSGQGRLAFLADPNGRTGRTPAALGGVPHPADHLGPGTASVVHRAVRT